MFTINPQYIKEKDGTEKYVILSVEEFESLIQTLQLSKVNNTNSIQISNNSFGLLQRYSSKLKTFERDESSRI
jgi:PHD/YefM family antitoxin component YafN of YafNO toxin-antitoxin module